MQASPAATPRPSRIRPWLRAALAALLVIGVLYLLLPVLSSMEAVRSRVEQAAATASGKDVAIAHLRLGYDFALHLSDVSVSEPDREPFLTVDEVAVRVSLSGLSADQPLRLRLRSPRFYAERLSAVDQQEGATTLPFRRVQIEDGYLFLAAAEEPLGPISVSVDAIRAGQEAHLEMQIDPELPTLEAFANIGTPGGILSLASLRVEWSDVPLAILHQRFPSIASGSLEGSLDLKGEASGALTDLTGSGSLRVEGFRYTTDAFALAGEVDAPFDVEVNKLTLQPPGLRLVAVTWSVAELAGKARDAKLSGTITRDGEGVHAVGRLSVDTIEAKDPTSEGVVEGLSVSGNFDGSWSATAPPAVRVDPAVASGSLDEPLDLKGEASGVLTDLKGSGSLRVEGFRYKTDAFAIAGEVDAPFDVEGNKLTLQPPGLRLAAVTWSVAELAGKARDAKLSGTITRDGEGVHAVGRLSVGTIEAHDPTSERVIEGLSVSGNFDGRWSATAPPAVRVDLAAASGEVLWNRFYADIGQHPASFASDIKPSAKHIDLSNIDARVKGVGSVKGSARLDAAAAGVIRFDTQIEVADLNTLYALALRDPYQERFPILARTTVAGSLNARTVYVRQSAGFSLGGNLRLGEVAISATEPAVRLRGLSLDMPLQLGNEGGGAPKSGELRIRGMRFGDVDVGELAAALEVRNNAVELASPVSVQLLGGALQIDEFVFEEITSAQPRASMGLMVRDLGLEGLTTAMGWPPLTGTMSGAIPKVTATDNQVRSEGEIGVQVFGGDIGVRNVKIDQLFSSVPTYGLDLDFREISLSRLTETLEVGRVSGVVQGGASNLAIVNGQPLSFDAWMETVERSGVSQRISVSAIRQLSILGGSGGDVFTQGILGFFDEYRYAKMGFKCSLKNDRFLLRGVESDDGKEYLVVGSTLPPRVNVVSHSQEIAFPEMVRRLQRVTTAEAAQSGKEVNE